MEEVVAIEPEARLMNLSPDRFTGRPVFGHPAAYRCAVCGTSTRFQLGRKNPEAFTPSIHAALDAASGPAVPWETDYTDFCCLGCGLPVRVTHEVHEFAMSSYRYLPLRVYEYVAGS
jgi:hypothetical protein